MGAISQFTNRNSLKVLIKDLNIEELEKVKSNIEIIIKQREQELIELKQKQNQKIEKIDNIKKIIKQSGLTVDDLLGDTSQAVRWQKKPRKKVPPKYRIEDSQGKVHEWTGRGKTPKVFQDHFDRGHSREGCLIIENISL